MRLDHDKLAAMVPSRRALTIAMESNERLGHENLGSLSESHGFLPRSAPELQLPVTHQDWDELAERLPELYRSLYLRRAVSAMPLLSAAEAELPDRFLLRASVILTLLAHAYYDVESRPPAGLPECLVQPWDTVTQRLGKPLRSMSVIDMVAYNWRLIDPACADPMRVENLLPLCATVGSREQNVSWMTLVEVLARSAPFVGAVVRAQEAVRRNDSRALKQELLGIIDSLRHITFVSFAKTNPHPYSDLYVDPVVWSKTVVTVSSPIQAEVDQGPAGTGMPLFHLLDIFFGRADYTTTLGHEVLKIRQGYPAHWRAFLTAAEVISVPAYVVQQGDRALSGIFQEAMQAYAGENGLLGRHRLKAYGYIDLSFKVGRNATVAGFSGHLRDRVWDRTDAELDLARVERNQRLPRFAHHAPVKRIEVAHAEGTEWVKQVVFDVTGTGIHYQPGDRCAVLPAHSAELVEKTLQALRARGDEPIVLNAAWRRAVALREGYERATSLTTYPESISYGKVEAECELT